MEEKERFVFSDRLVKPADDLIHAVLGKKSVLWQDVMRLMNKDSEGMSGEWRYYNDGKQWLYKVNQKKKTICWIAVLADTFRVTFYFGDKAEPAIENSDLPAQIKGNFKNGKRYGKIRAISLKMTDEKDVETIRKLVAIKSSLK